MNLQTKLEHYEKLLLTDDIRNNPEKLNALLAPHFFEIGSSGKVLYTDRNVEEPIGSIQLELQQFKCMPLCEHTALVTYETVDKITGRHALRSSIWQHTGEDWQMVFHQGTIAQK